MSVMVLVVFSCGCSCGRFMPLTQPVVALLSTTKAISALVSSNVAFLAVSVIIVLYLYFRCFADLEIPESRAVNDDAYQLSMLQDRPKQKFPRSQKEIRDAEEVMRSHRFANKNRFVSFPLRFETCGELHRDAASLLGSSFIPYISTQVSLCVSLSLSQLPVRHSTAMANEFEVFFESEDQ
ncbi:hypothetical protein QBC43DRAFT_74723 [Cladorrhinum sp. PSN259]|nr:hypothetical protein QBC43DRAFT_74723 [Cladorrhinum sp. PSN259]